MKKAVGMFVVGMVFLIALASFSSATYYGGYFDPYYGQGDYDSYYSYSARTSGGYYGPKQTTTKEYSKVSEKYWDGYDWVDRTTYVREKRESPLYGGYGYGYGGYGYQPTYKNYYNYPDYNYRNYNYNFPRSSYWY